MKSDSHGCSTCPNGQEQFEYFTVGGYPGSKLSQRIQYDYRTPGGKLFSCVAVSLDAARAKRDAWLEPTPQPSRAEYAADYARTP